MGFLGGLFSTIGYRAKGTISNDRSPLQNPARVLSQLLQGRVLVGAQGGKAPGSSKDPKVYITKKRPKTDSHGALLTQDMPMITSLSPEF